MVAAALECAKVGSYCGGKNETVAAAAQGYGLIRTAGGPVSDWFSNILGGIIATVAGGLILYHILPSRRGVHSAGEVRGGPGVRTQTSDLSESQEKIEYALRFVDELVGRPMPQIIVLVGIAVFFGGIFGEKYFGLTGFVVGASFLALCVVYRYDRIRSLKRALLELDLSNFEIIQIRDIVGTRRWKWNFLGELRSEVNQIIRELLKNKTGIN